MRIDVVTIFPDYLKVLDLSLIGKAADRGPLDLHVHDLRRSLGSWMLMNGVDIAVVSRTLGHKSIAVTEKVYAHLLPEKISNATRLAVEAMRTGKV